MERFVITVNGFQPLTIFTKPSILVVAAALDPPLRSFLFYIRQVHFPTLTEKNWFLREPCLKWSRKFLTFFLIWEKFATNSNGVLNRENCCYLVRSSRPANLWTGICPENLHRRVFSYELLEHNCQSQYFEIDENGTSPRAFKSNAEAILKVYMKTATDKNFQDSCLDKDSMDGCLWLYIISFPCLEQHYCLWLRKLRKIAAIFLSVHRR